VVWFINGDVTLGRFCEITFLSTQNLNHQDAIVTCWFDFLFLPHFRRACVAVWNSLFSF